MGGGLTESNVIAAYNYPYEMRAIFNESDGARGAFVVATNASWGIDLPILPTTPCGAYYDDLANRAFSTVAPRPTPNTTSTPKGTCPQDAVHPTWFR